METYEVTIDGRTLGTFRTENDAWRYLLRQQGQSIYYATIHGGYDIIYPNGSSLAESYKRQD